MQPAAVCVGHLIGCWLLTVSYGAVFRLGRVVWLCEAVLAEAVSIAASWRASSLSGARSKLGRSRARWMRRSQKWDSSTAGSSGRERATPPRWWRHIEPRANGQPICSGCEQRRPGYDRQPKPRLFDFVPLCRRNRPLPPDGRPSRAASYSQILLRRPFLRVRRRCPRARITGRAVSTLNRPAEERRQRSRRRRWTVLQTQAEGMGAGFDQSPATNREPRPARGALPGLSPTVYRTWVSRGSAGLASTLLLLSVVNSSVVIRRQ
jgi:hypothetical protein